MYKFLLVSAVLSLQLSDILSLSIASNPYKSYMVREPDMKNNDFRRFVYYTEPPQKVEDPGDKPAVQDSSSDLKKSLDNLAKEISELAGVPIPKSPTELSNSVNVVGRQLSSEYLVTKGIGAHKLHLRKLPWNKARKVCIDEGAQLADISSDAEEKILLRMLSEESVEFAWIGYHDMFEEGDWVSVLGEPFGKSGWDRWWKVRLPNPDNSGPDGSENCGCLMRDGGGINDNSCAKDLPFICKITAL